MASPTHSPVTRILASIANGDDTAQERLWALVYDELRLMARQQMAGEAPGHVLQPTALVHQAYFRLFGGENGQFESRRHFFAAAARAMRQILIEDARTRGRLKRGGGIRPRQLDDGIHAPGQDPTELLAVHEALERLEKEDARKGDVVNMRYFTGLTVKETAEALGVSERTVNLEWRFARAWLHRELSKGDTGVTPTNPHEQ